MAEILATVGKEQQTDWDMRLPHAEIAHNKSVRAATGRAPNKVRIGQPPRMPITVSCDAGHHSLDRDRLAYCDLARDRQHHPLTVTRIEGRNSSLAAALLKQLPYNGDGCTTCPWRPRYAKAYARTQMAASLWSSWLPIGQARSKKIM